MAAQPPRVFCLFSKHLPELNWSDLGRAVKDAGFEGVDLTVRPGGHVLPERAADDLPRAIEALTAQGVKVPMITTDLTSASAPVARPLLQAAARSGVKFFKTGYWRYSSSPDVRAQVAETGKALEGLAALARECGIEMGFHNHQAYIGAALWDIAPFIDRLDARWAGYYFDPRHAVAEGGGGAWKAATHLVAPRLKMVAVKDCRWVKSPKGWDRELPARRRTGRLDVCRQGAARCAVHRSDLASPRVPDPVRHEAHARRGEARPRFARRFLA